MGAKGSWKKYFSEKMLKVTFDLVFNKDRKLEEQLVCSMSDNGAKCFMVKVMDYFG